MLHRVLIGYFRGVLPEKDCRMTNPPPPCLNKHQSALSRWAVSSSVRTSKKKREREREGEREREKRRCPWCWNAPRCPLSLWGDGHRRACEQASPSFFPHVSPAGAMGSHQFQPPDAWEEEEEEKNKKTKTQNHTGHGRTCGFKTP